MAVKGLPSQFPYAWCASWGEDPFGLWCSLRFKGVQQVFRWIEAGSFVMGSPPTEAERRDNEDQREVTLSQGFWLADTATSQALWTAVMGNQPSQFKGEDLPVEQVSWDDVHEFLTELNQQVPDLNLLLPTEAQWEYACRAGSQGPFSFDTLSPERANYNGNFPYDNGEKGVYRKTTLAVKSFAANVWGLYQMHGNVWEWCRDWYTDQPPVDSAANTEGTQLPTVLDPSGPEYGEQRVLRGGCCFSNGRSLRSACRFFGRPSGRFRDIGFRLARASERL